MVRGNILLPLLASAASIFSAEAKIAGETKNIAGSYIVEFEDSQDSVEFFNHIGSKAKTRMNLDYQLFKGVSIQFDDLKTAEEEAAKLNSLASVKQVWPNRVYTLPKDEVVWTGRSGGQDYIKNVKRQLGNDTFTPHVMTQVDKLRANGVTGKGVKIGIIDSGVDYTHPALGGCFGSEDCLFTFGTDIVGDDYNGDNTPVPDADPYDGCGGHGTHVSGIIAAQVNELGFTGVAPDVKLGMFRVFGCTGGASNDVLIDAYMQAFEAGSNIITASIGGSSGWSEDPWSVAVSRIVEAGVPCTVSAGNDGAAGLFYASTASNGKKVTSIASIDNEVTPLLLTESNFTVGSGDNQEFGYALGEPGEWANISLPLWTPSFNITDTAQACTALPDNTPDLSGYIVLIRRGTCTFVEKATNAAQHGAKYVLYYNNVRPGALGPAVTGVNGVLGTGMVTADQGESWVKSLEANSTIKLNMLDPLTAPVSLSYAENTVTGGFASSFTTWNPTFELDIKPQLASPGGNILSTYPIPLGTYAILSGTSMACPLVAAIYALISNVRGTLDPATIENLLSATAKPQFLNDGEKTYSTLAPVSQLGGGIVQAYDAAYATTLLSTSSLAFNDTDNFVDTLNFTIKNLGTEDVTYELGSVGASTGYTFSDSIYPDPFPGLQLTDEYATVVLSEPKVTVAAGDEVVVSVTVTPPALDAARLPVYSGYITLNGTNGDSLSLPYNGAVGSLHNARVLDEGYLSISSDQELNPVTGNASFVLPRGNTSTSNATYPVAVTLLAFGSPLVNVQVVPLDAAPGATASHIFGSPLKYASRDPYVLEWDGKLADGTTASAGQYKFRFEALHIFGDASDPADYDTAESSVFTVRYN
ncbi:subtilisin-like protein [Annulohypoxylon maeteangense]|uniref:subtilisin-like protein n=1 Tax=Annulohypoxylon maeteangense TaxID=1927788 RepID=UPI002007799C|nr:subtilisin-like protein [Annulohypoxylon maeteangense]KAI0883496.1 subtilisin-like protein [Annulohypoxylon maeteangense]